jgi:hypothetical protein
MSGAVASGDKSRRGSGLPAEMKPQSRFEFSGAVKNSAAPPLCFKPPTVLSHQWCDVQEATRVDVDQLAFCIRIPVSRVMAACLVDTQTCVEPFFNGNEEINA